MVVKVIDRHGGSFVFMQRITLIFVGNQLILILDKN